MFYPAMLGLIAVAAIIAFFALRKDLRKPAPVTPRPDAKPVTEISALDLRNMLQAQPNEPVVVLFHSPKCPACDIMKPNFLAAAASHAGNARFVMINVLDNKSTARRLGLTRIPVTMVFKGSDDSGLKSHLGVLEAAAINDLIASALK